MSPAEVDGELSRLWRQEQTAKSHARGYRESIKRMGERSGVRDFLAAAEQRAAEARAEAEPYEAEFFRRGGWRRYFLVTNNNGHVHNGMNCSTCFRDTQFAWLVDLAARTEEEMVAEFGEMACTVCFPSAPTMKGFGDGTSAVARATAAEKEARAAAKAEREAKKAAKMLVEPVVVEPTAGWSETVRTVARAKEELRSAVTFSVYYGDNDGRRFDTVMKLSAALIRKGFSAVEVETMVERADKKARKEMASA